MLKFIKELFGIGLKNPNKHGLEGASTAPNQDFSQRVEQYSAPVEAPVQEQTVQEKPKTQKKAPASKKPSPKKQETKSPSQKSGRGRKPGQKNKSTK